MARITQNPEQFLCQNDQCEIVQYERLDRSVYTR